MGKEPYMHKQNICSSVGKHQINETTCILPRSTTSLVIEPDLSKADLTFCHSLLEIWKMVIIWQ